MNLRCIKPLAIDLRRLERTLNDLDRAEHANDAKRIDAANRELARAITVAHRNANA